jgi:murein DD-endopeptidase MepM/ murein hydrolase activator NlpD
MRASVPCESKFRSTTRSAGFALFFRPSRLAWGAGSGSRSLGSHRVWGRPPPRCLLIALPLTAALFAQPAGSYADPGSAVHADAPDTPSTVAAPQDAAALARRLGLGGRRAAVRLLIGPPDAAWIEAAAVSGDTPHDKLVWPVEGGRLLRGLLAPRKPRKHRAPKHARMPRMHRHAGLDIGADTGTAIRAAQSGLVVYSARAVRGYGQLIAIVHADGSAALYAHCSDMHVVPGELVTRGQTIGAVGQTGRARGPHLHFEYRVNGEPRDPTPLFE